MSASGRRNVVVAAAVGLLACLTAGRACVLRDREQQAWLASQVLTSGALDVARLNTFVWKVPRDTWPYTEGEARFALLVTGTGKACDVAGASPLRVHVSASGVLKSGVEVDRLIRNAYFTSDDPLAPATRLWRSSAAESAEYGLGGVQIYPEEVTTLRIVVVTPDPTLAACGPRVTLAPSSDAAAVERLPTLRIVRDAVFAVGIGLVLTLAWLAWPKRTGGGPPA